MNQTLAAPPENHAPDNPAAVVEDRATAPCPPSPPAAAQPALQRPLSFTVEEQAIFQEADRQAAGMVAGVMLAIFAAALLGYALIAYLAFQGGS